MFSANKVAIKLFFSSRYVMSILYAAYAYRKPISKTILRHATSCEGYMLTLNAVNQSVRQYFILSEKLLRIY